MEGKGIVNMKNINFNLALIYLKNASKTSLMSLGGRKEIIFEVTNEKIVITNSKGKKSFYKRKNR